MARHRMCSSSGLVTKISYAGPVESLHENVLLLMITLATSECVN